MGGMTRPAAVVFDRDSRDIIIVGQANAGESPISLDDFVVALRALFIHEAWPLVSIDKTPETHATGKQNVRFAGGIENTEFGKELLEADVVLKKLGLGHLKAGVWGVESYFDLFRKQWQGTGEGDHVQSRFWFTAGEPICASRTGVAIVKKSTVGVETQVLAATKNGKPAADLSGVRDMIGDRFSVSMTANYDEVCQYFPEVGRVRALFNVVGLAAGIRKLWMMDNSIRSELDYWLSNYTVAPTTTPKEYPLLSRDTTLERSGATWTVSVDGGVEIKGLVLDLIDGSEDAFREVVLLTRPGKNTLSWSVPLEGWNVPGYSDEAVGASLGSAGDLGVGSAREKPGCSISRQVFPIGNPPSIDDFAKSFVAPQLRTEIPESRTLTGLAPQRFSPDIGGVMLRGAAKVAGSGEAQVDLTSGDFSLVVGGENARLDPTAFRKFVTALWSVYYCREDPGISIDPIAPGVVDKHLVRYIGNVVNTDLGRVMREADYTMKKWAVGTEKPSIPGFSDVDALMARMPDRAIGAWRRFWFVPEDMEFARAGDALLFKDGRMSVQTEYMFAGKTGESSAPDRAFAKFFTDHYQEIAKKYPMYAELFDYAKLVALAKYLKQSGIPLSWFLLANKDQILTEDSPSLVDELAKGSEYFRGVQITGGVDLVSEGRYIYDREAQTAIAKAVANLPTATLSRSDTGRGRSPAVATAEPFSFDYRDAAYSVVPQHSLTCGKDRRGIRYQTDLAFREDSQPALELVRYFNPRRPKGGEFGNGWRLMIPYRIAPADSTTREFLNVLIPVRMAVDNRLTGEREVLTFSTDRYSIAGYAPDSLKSSQVIGLFIMSDASYRLADKLGNQFWFDQGGYMTDMFLFSDTNHVHYEYSTRSLDALAKSPYEVQPAGDSKVDFLNVRLPKMMQLVDPRTGQNEELTFTEAGLGGIAGYVPRDTSKSQVVILAILSDASFQMLDKTGNELKFDPAGQFSGMIVSPKAQRPLESVSRGRFRVTFDYEYDRESSVRIARANVYHHRKRMNDLDVVYRYDDQGRLCEAVSPMTGALGQR
jgi:hypothetical protein